APVPAGERQEVGGLQALPRPAMLGSSEGGHALASPCFEASEARVHVVGRTAAMILTAHDQPIAAALGGLQPDIMIGFQRVPNERVLDAARWYLSGDCVGPHRDLLGMDGNPIVDR